jgi:hypothetical protein
MIQLAVRTSFGNVLFRNGAVVTKRCDVEPERLRREAMWLQAIPSRLGPHFPQVLSVRSGEEWFEYDMPYYDMPTLANQFLGETACVRELCQTLAHVCMFVSEELHPLQSSLVAGETFERHYYQKLLRRLEEGGARSSNFRKLTDFPWLRINGTVVLHPEAVWRTLRDHPGLTEPSSGAMVHGDLKLDNIMSLDGRFVLLDPRGGNADGGLTSDPLEDYAKIRTSTQAYYDLARGGLLELDREGSDVSWSWKSAAEAPIARLELADATVMDFLSEGIGRPGDWTQLKLSVITAFLLMANAPVHLEPKSDETLSIYLYCRGALLLQDCLRLAERRGTE